MSAEHKSTASRINIREAFERYQVQQQQHRKSQTYSSSKAKASLVVGNGQPITNNYYAHPPIPQAAVPPNDTKTSYTPDTSAREEQHEEVGSRHNRRRSYWSRCLALFGIIALFAAILPLTFIRNISWKSQTNRQPVADGTTALNSRMIQLMPFGWTERFPLDVWISAEPATAPADATIQSLRNEILRCTVDPEIKSRLLQLADESISAALDASRHNATAFRLSHSLSADWLSRAPVLLEQVSAAVNAGASRVNDIEPILKNYTTWIQDKMEPLHESIKKEQQAYVKLNASLYEMGELLHTKRDAAVDEKYLALGTFGARILGQDAKIKRWERQISNLNKIGGAWAVAHGRAESLIWMVRLYIDAAENFQSWLKQGDSDMRLSTPHGWANFLRNLQGWIQELEQRQSAVAPTQHAQCNAAPRA